MVKKTTLGMLFALILHCDSSVTLRPLDDLLQPGMRQFAVTDRDAAFVLDGLLYNESELEQAGEAYALMASDKCGKVAVVFDEEVK